MQLGDDWSYVPNAIVNDDGQANVDNSNVDNKNGLRLAVRNKRLCHRFSPAADLAAGFGEFGLELQQVGVVCQVHLQHGAQQQGGQLGLCFGLQQVGLLHAFGRMLGQDELGQHGLQVAHGWLGQGVAIFSVELGVECGEFFVQFVGSLNDR